MRQSQALVSFKCGRMNYDGKMVTPDRQKGTLKVMSDMQPGMTNLQWCDERGTVQNTMTLFPGDAKFEKVKQTEDRVYLLEIQPGPRRLFFWMQEPDRDGDADRCKKVHEAINNIQSNSNSNSNQTTNSAAAAASSYRPAG